MAHLLLIDDDPDLIASRCARPSPTTGSRWLAPAPKGWSGSGPNRLTLFSSTCVCPTSPGLEVYQQIRKFDARIPVIFVTLTKSADAAIEAMKQGAYDYLFKPLDLHQLQRVVGEALEVARRMREPAVLPKREPDPEVEGAIVGSCPAMREVYKAIGRVAAQDVPVLITGESGTGKELVARAIYQHGSRAKAPFLALNCAAIPENAAGERAVRPRERRLHRRRPPPHRQVRAVQRRHPLPRRDRRHAAGLAGQDAAAARRSRPSSVSAATRPSRPTCG